MDEPIDNDATKQGTNAGDVPLPDEIRRVQQIEEIVRTDRQAFESWIKDPRSATNLDIPPAALRYVLIPRRILELADDPSAVDILILNKAPERVEAFVLEHKAGPITASQSLLTFLEEEQERLLKSQAEAEANGKPFIFIHNPPPQ